ncbi:SAM-dependent methyltransferase [uncultured Algoriphagus sp.]|uniref:SAM-dependent methyltransferase n=1 Tax=uncultured Algoriphagus sp. TaxID=417365 RepID=UPI0030EEB797|tara:strand:- start:30964 stop:31554 length:591 start_codon:yes stop_codon:yes gene_type:complete
MVFLDKDYWTDRYSSGKTIWDIGFASPPLVQYLDQIENKDIRVMIPGAGSGYEAVYALQTGFTDFHILDFSKSPLERFVASNPEFPMNHVHHENFFKHEGLYDLILEQTFFCALDPSLRIMYAKKMQELLKQNGKLVGVWFDRDFDLDGPPFGGEAKEYKDLFEKYFEIKTIAPCYNSISERLGSEVFLILENSKI